jgi:hypothetical protein
MGSSRENRRKEKKDRERKDKEEIDKAKRRYRIADVPASFLLPSFPLQASRPNATRGLRASVPL